MTRHPIQKNRLGKRYVKYMNFFSIRRIDGFNTIRFQVIIVINCNGGYSFSVTKGIQKRKTKGDLI